MAKMLTNKNPSGSYNVVNISSKHHSNSLDSLCLRKLRSRTNMDEAVYVLNRYLTSWFIPGLILFGTIGYTVCLTVLLRRPPFPKDIQGWFTAFCFAEIYVLILSGVDYYFLSMFNISMREANNYTCHVMPIFIYSGYFMICWIQAGISVLRAYATCKPLRSKIDITKRRSNIALLLVACFGLTLYTIMVMIEVEFKPFEVTSNHTYLSSRYNNSLSTSEDAATGNTVNAYCYTSSRFIIVDFIFKDGIPFVLLLVCTVIICNSLRRVISRNTPMRCHRRRVTWTLLLMNSTYFFSQPLFNTIILDHHTNKYLNLSTEKFYLTLHCLTLLTHLDFATNWLFFLMLGKHFRKHLKLSMCSLCFGCGSKCCPHQEGEAHHDMAIVLSGFSKTPHIRNENKSLS